MADTASQMWKGLSVATASPSPIVVVLSGSMEPAFQRGDLLFLWNRNLYRETDVGEVVVYNVQGEVGWSFSHGDGAVRLTTWLLGHTHRPQGGPEVWLWVGSPPRAPGLTAD